MNQELDELILRSNVIDGLGIKGKKSDVVAQIVLERDRMQGRIERLVSRKNEIEIYLNNCVDYYGLLLRWHYGDGKTWQSIALSLGGKNTADGIRKSCHRYVNNNP